MSEVIRIEPAVTRLTIDAREVEVADVALGGLPRGAVVVLAEPGELTGSVLDLVNRFAEHGFDSASAEVAVDAGDDTVTALVGGLIDHLGERGWRSDQTGVVGFGTAARAAYLAAATFPIGAAVSAAVQDTPGAQTHDLRPVSVRAPWLGMFAVGDPRVHGDVIRTFGAEVYRLSPVHTEVVGYQGVAESFYRDSREPVEHAAAFDCWQRTLEWLNVRVVPRPSPLAEAWEMRHAAA
jgi:carboxymethylenebutenolidase